MRRGEGESPRSGLGGTSWGGLCVNERVGCGWDGCCEMGYTYVQGRERCSLVRTKDEDLLARCMSSRVST